MQRPLPLNDDGGILQHPVRTDPKYGFPRPKTTGAMSIATWPISPSARACPPISPAVTPISPPSARACARMNASSIDAANSYDASGVKPH